MGILARSFYSRSPTTVARELIGKVIVRVLSNREKLEGIIVESEAYGGFKDPASHAFRGMTKRNSVMFGEAGHAYVYFTYGFHHCLNFVTERAGSPSAVLIRAVEPTKGLNFMQRKRGTWNIKGVANGPGKLCQAFAIDKSLNDTDVTAPNAPIYVLDTNLKFKVLSGPRIGIKSGLENRWRFYAAESEFLSK